MTKPPSDPYVGALRDDWPSPGDQLRIRRRLVGAGVGLSLVLVPQAAAASSSLFKAGLISSFSSRFMNLSLISQFSVVAAATTVSITVPVWITEQSRGSTTVEKHSQGVNAATNVQRASPAHLVEQTVPLVSEPVVSLATEVGLSEAKSIAHPPRAEIGAQKPPRESSSLAEETRLLDAALSAIRLGDLSRGAELLDQHEVRFANAKLGRERQRARQKLAEAQRHIGE